MNTIGYIFVVSGVVFCFLVAILLWAFSRKKGAQQKFLSLIFLAIGWYAFMYLYVSKGWIAFYPLLFRLGLPLYYLIPPCALFYTQLLLKERDSIAPRAQLFHGLPFLLAIIDVSVYYIKNYGHFAYIAKQVLLNPTNSFFVGGGIVPALTHYQCRPLQGVFYVILIGMVLYKFLRRKKRLEQISMRSLGWLLTLDIFLAVNYMFMFYSTFIQPSERYPVLEAGVFSAFVSIISFFLLSIRPFFTPAVIYNGIEKTGSEEAIEDKATMPQKTKNGDEDTQQKKALLSEDRVLEIANTLDHAMNDGQLFKKVNKLNDLADCLNLSPRYLSYVLSKHYNLNFNDYVNTFRINHVIQLIKTDEYKKFTLEAVAKEAGFSSRTTFFNAFKKQTGLSPTQYFAKQP